MSVDFSIGFIILNIFECNEILHLKTEFKINLGLHKQSK